jgi:hypothetical protein
MPLFGRDRNRTRTAQTHALSHPLRLRILEMVTRERGRSLSVESLTADLAKTPEYEHVKQAEVKYHRDTLQNAGLLPL